MLFTYNSEFRRDGHPTARRAASFDISTIVSMSMAST